MKKLLCIDGNSILNRQFYGIRPLSTPDGFPTNAIFGMVNVLIKQLEGLSPDYAAVAFDLKDDLGNAITGTCVASAEIYSEVAGASLLSASVNNQPKAPKFANHAKKQHAPRKVKISSLIKK